VIACDFLDQSDVSEFPPRGEFCFTGVLAAFDPVADGQRQVSL
jgi:hypothetical protein